MARSTARKRALNTLYEADEKGQRILIILQERIDVPGAPTPLPPYAIEIIQGVAEHIGTIDKALNAVANDWPVRRMGVVDRNILRLAAWEILYNDEIPTKVAIDEAIQLAKTLCDADAPSFIHAVLDAVSQHSEETLVAEREHYIQNPANNITNDNGDEASAIDETQRDDVPASTQPIHQDSDTTNSLTLDQ